MHKLLAFLALAATTTAIALPDLAPRVNDAVDAATPELAPRVTQPESSIAPDLVSRNLFYPDEGKKYICPKYKPEPGQCSFVCTGETAYVLDDKCINVVKEHEVKKKGLYPHYYQGYLDLNKGWGTVKWEAEYFDFKKEIKGIILEFKGYKKEQKDCKEYTWGWGLKKYTTVQCDFPCY